MSVVIGSDYLYNLLQYSEDSTEIFWVKDQCAVSQEGSFVSGAVSSRVIESNTLDGHMLYNSTTAINELQVYNFSAYIKANGRNEGRLRAGTDIGFAGHSVYDLGVVAATGSNSEITDVGDGWYRVSFDFNSQAGASSTNGLGIILRDSGSDIYTGDGVSGQFVFGMQLTKGSGVKPYKKTTNIASNGNNISPDLPFNHARIGYDNNVPAATVTASTEESGFDADAIKNQMTYEYWRPTAMPADTTIDMGSNKDINYIGLAAHTLGSDSVSVSAEYLTEVENLFTYSEQFDIASWGKTSATIDPDAILSPIGDLTADRIIDNADLTSHKTSRGFSTTPPIVDSDQITISIYAKAGELGYLWLQANAFGGSFIRGVFDLNSGTISSSGGFGDGVLSSVDMVDEGDGWYRCIVSGIPNTTDNTSSGSYDFIISYSPTISSYSGDGLSGLYLWGAQVVLGTDPLPYQKTTATTGAGLIPTSLDVDTSPSDNSALMLLFNQVNTRYIKLSFAGASVFSLGVVYAGSTLDMIRPFYAGHTPDSMGRMTTIKPTKSVGGQWLGRSIIRKGFNSSYSWKNIPVDWYRSNVDPFAVSAQSYPFFIAWNALEEPEDCLYAWTDKDISPTLQGQRDLVEFGFDVEGVSDA
jgi:hypothetical protein